jgi:hypothetical protein
MVDSKRVRTRIINDIIEALEAIDSTDGYHYTPDIVAPRPVDVPQWTLVYNQHDTLIYLVNGGDISESHHASGGTQKAILEITILGSYLYDKGDVDPLTYDVDSRDETRDKMVDDIKRAVWTDPGRGGLAMNTDVTSVRVVHVGFPELQNADGPDLAAVEVRLEMEYFYRRGDIS